MDDKTGRRRNLKNTALIYISEYKEFSLHIVVLTDQYFFYAELFQLFLETGQGREIEIDRGTVKVKQCR